MTSDFEAEDIRPQFTCPKCDGPGTRVPAIARHPDEGDVAAAGAEPVLTHFDCPACGLQDEAAAANLAGLLELMGLDSIDQLESILENRAEHDIALAAVVRGGDPEFDGDSGVTVGICIYVDHTIGVEVEFPVTVSYLLDAAEDVEREYVEELDRVAALEAESDEPTDSDEDDDDDGVGVWEIMGSVGSLRAEQLAEQELLSPPAFEIRIAGGNGAGVFITAHRWIGAVDGECISEERFTVTLHSDDRIVQLRSRRLTDADLLGLRDFLKFTATEDLPHISVPRFQSANGALEARVVESSSHTVTLEIGGRSYLDEGDDDPDIDGVGFDTSRAALWEALTALDDRLGLESHIPDDLSELE